MRKLWNSVLILLIILSACSNDKIKPEKPFNSLRPYFNKVKIITLKKGQPAPSDGHFLDKHNGEELEKRDKKQMKWIEYLEGKKEKKK